MPALACGVDIGSTNLKVVLVDPDGRTAWSRAEPTPRVMDRGAHATDAETLVATVEAMIIEGWRATGKGVPLLSIACAGVGEDGIGLRSDLSPTGPALAWFDERAASEAAELARLPAADARIGLEVGADRTLAKWLWLARNAPEAIDRATGGWVALTDYPAVRWTGHAFMSRSLAARTAAYDVFARQWIDELRAASGAPALPEVVDAGTVIGPVRGEALRGSGAAGDDTMVVAGGHDHPVAAMVIRRSDPTGRVDSLGTANVVYGELDRDLAPIRHPRLAFSIPVRPGPGLACLGVIALAARIRGDAAGAAALMRLLAAPRMPGGPLAARGGDEEDELRALIEAATLDARDALSEMDALGVPTGRLYATGGWSRSRSLMELRASVFGAPIDVIDEPELVAVSAALISAEGIGCPLPFLAGQQARRVEPLEAWRRAYATVDSGLRAVARTIMPTRQKRGEENEAL